VRNTPSTAAGAVHPIWSNPMSFPIEGKLVIAVSSSALFDLSESDRVFRE
jgi:hypothetical protein